MSRERYEDGIMGGVGVGLRFLGYEIAFLSLPDLGSRVVNPMFMKKPPDVRGKSLTPQPVFIITSINYQRRSDSIDDGLLKITNDLCI